MGVQPALPQGQPLGLSFALDIHGLSHGRATLRMCMESWSRTKQYTQPSPLEGGGCDCRRNTDLGATTELAFTANSSRANAADGSGPERLERIPYEGEVAL